MYDLQCEHVSKRFGALAAVDGVSFEVPAGSFFSILGPSGCGKTTLMRMIAGFEEPDGGDIRIKGQSVLGTPPNRRNVKMVFQHLALFPMMNVGENIAYGLRCRGAKTAEIRRRVADVLERIGLPEVADKEVGQLSGGQKQRIAIARCMVLEPDVLLLDEPLGALDLKLRERMKIELKLLQHQFDTTFLYITHDQSEALVMSDRVAVMNAGRFEQIGTPQELYHAPNSTFVAGFVGDSNRWSGRVVGAADRGVAVETTVGATLVCVEGGNGARRVAPGEEVEVFVRPEAIAVAGKDATAPATDGGHNRLEGVVDSLLFNGADSRVLVRTGREQLIQVAFPHAGRGPEVHPGEPVQLTWPAEHTKCFRDAP
ncbi:MAG TPA: ABC transporter ATP-binding protein [Geminicoccaceae bacterium]|nr:ABC transporter ATP-binding protein [Geminicoccaceae bacterium]